MSRIRSLFKGMAWEQYGYSKRFFDYYFQVFFIAPDVR